MIGFIVGVVVGAVAVVLTFAYAIVRSERKEGEP